MIKKIYGHTGRFMYLRNKLASVWDKNDALALSTLENDFNEMVESRDHWKQKTERAIMLAAEWLQTAKGDTMKECLAEIREALDREAGT